VDDGLFQIEQVFHFRRFKETTYAVKVDMPDYGEALILHTSRYEI